MTNRAVLTEIEESDEWRALANCKGIDTNIFFPSASDTEGIARAKEFCKRCRVKRECLEYAISHEGTRATPGEDLGIYGGLGYDERRLFARRRSSGRG